MKTNKGKGLEPSDEVGSNEELFKEALSDRFHKFAIITSRRLIKLTSKIDQLTESIKKLDQVTHTLATRTLMQMNQIEALVTEVACGQDSHKH